MKSDKFQMLYCIAHEEIVDVDFGEITGLPVHLVPKGISDWEHCVGPFATCPPPEVEDWDVLFADEEGIQDLLDFMRQEETGVV